MQILTPSHPRWREFTSTLSDRLLAEVPAHRTSGCDNTHREAVAVMTVMGDIDIKASLTFFEKYGGYCDCEILFNVAKNVGCTDENDDDPRFPPGPSIRCKECGTTGTVYFFGRELVCKACGRMSEASEEAC